MLKTLLHTLIGLLRVLAGLSLLTVIGLLILWLVFGGARPPANDPKSTPAIPSPADVFTPPPPPLAGGASCGDPAYAAPAALNARSLTSLTWSPFGPPEMGWEIYVPLIAAEIGTACSPADPGFAAALARWAKANDLPATGEFTPALFQALKARWHRKRPFSRIDPANCPAGETNLAIATAEESYGPPMRLRPAALAAYRRMIAAARAEAPQIFTSQSTLDIFSGFRDPAADAERCAETGSCDGLRRTLCSAHRTGLALDLYVGGDPASTDDLNRLQQSRNPAYRWLVRNAHRFGFVPYAFEPWHWEWTGEDI